MSVGLAGEPSPGGQRIEALERVAQRLHDTHTKNCVTGHPLAGCVHRDAIYKWAEEILALTWGTLAHEQEKAAWEEAAKMVEGSQILDTSDSAVDLAIKCGATRALAASLRARASALTPLPTPPAPLTPRGERLEALERVLVLAQAWANSCDYADQHGQPMHGRWPWQYGDDLVKAVEELRPMCFQPLRPAPPDLQRGIIEEAKELFRNAEVMHAQGGFVGDNIDRWLNNVQFWRVKAALRDTTPPQGEE